MAVPSLQFALNQSLVRTRDEHDMGVKCRRRQKQPIIPADSARSTKKAATVRWPLGSSVNRAGAWDQAPPIGAA